METFTRPLSLLLGAARPMAEPVPVRGDPVRQPPPSTFTASCHCPSFRSLTPCAGRPQGAGFSLGG